MILFWLFVVLTVASMVMLTLSGESRTALVAALILLVMIILVRFLGGV